MTTRLAHRPRYSPARFQARPLSRSHQDYLHQRWTYRQQHILRPRHAPGYGISLVPWGRRPMRHLVKRLA